MDTLRPVATLDTRTLLTVSAFVAAAIAFISLVHAFINRKRSASIYACGFILSFGGILLYQETEAPYIGITALLADFLMCGFYFCLAWGLRSNIRTHREWPPRFWMYLGTWIALQLSFAHENLPLRLIFNALVIAVLTVEYLVALYEIPHAMPPAIMRVVRTVALSQMIALAWIVCFIVMTSNWEHTSIQISFIRNCTHIFKVFYLVLWAQLVMGIEVAALIEELKKDNMALQNLAATDTLTSLFNRFQFAEKADAEIARADRYGEPLSLIMYDLDHFKRVNDTWGHQIGDEVLKRSAAVVKRQIRDTDTLVRWGGEEFLIIAPRTSLAGAVILADKVRKSIASEGLPKVGKITASFGVAEWKRGENVEPWLHRADKALYLAKNGGRDRVVSFDSATES